MGDIELVDALSPDPIELTDLLLRATRLPWPDSEDQRLGFFSALGFRDCSTVETAKDDPPSNWRRFSTALIGEADGSAVTSRGRLLALQIAAYNERDQDGAAAREGFYVLRQHLSSALGPPIEEWGTAQEPACAWHPAPMTVEMYCFQRGSSGVLIGLSRTGSSQASST